MKTSGVIGSSRLLRFSLHTHPAGRQAAVDAGLPGTAWETVGSAGLQQHSPLPTPFTHIAHAKRNSAPRSPGHGLAVALVAQRVLAEVDLLLALGQPVGVSLTLGRRRGAAGRLLMRISELHNNPEQL